VSLRDQILAAQDRDSKIIDVPEWGVEVEVRSMSAGARIQLISDAYDADTGKTDVVKIYPVIIVSCLHDPKTGQPIFTMDDKEEVMNKSAAVIERLAQEAMGMSAMGDNSLTEAGKELLGNPSDDSSMN